MPQLLPFSFVSSVTTLIIVFCFVIWVLSVLVLPLFVRAQVARMYICNL